MNGAAAVQELQKIFKHKSLNDLSEVSHIEDAVTFYKPRCRPPRVYVSQDGAVRARFPPADSSRLIKDILRTNQVKAAQSHDNISRPVIAPPDMNLSPDCAKKFTTKIVAVKKRFIPAAQKVVDRCLLQGVVCNDVFSATQGLARVIVAICSNRRMSSAITPITPVTSRPKSWSISPSPDQGEEGAVRPRGFSATPNLAASRSHDSLDSDSVASASSHSRSASRKASRESIGGSGALELLRKCCSVHLETLKKDLSAHGSEKLNGQMFEEVISTVRKLCEAVSSDLETEMLEVIMSRNLYKRVLMQLMCNVKAKEHDEKPYEVTEEVFTKKRSDLIDIVEAHFKNGQTEVTLPTVTRGNVTRRSKSCVLRQSEPNMRRTLSDAKRYFTKSKNGQEPPRNCTSASSQETVRDPRDSVISNSSTSSSNSSYDDEGLAKNMPRYQKKKIRAAMVQTQVPTGFNMKRRTSSTITQDEAILLGVTMSQIGARRSAIGEESEPCTSDEDARASSTWRDSGIDTISSTYTSINASLSDEETDEFKGQRPLSPLVNSFPSFHLPSEEFLSIEVSGELGGHFSKSKKTLGQSPNNMGRYFRIHVKTNIEKLQLQSYVIYKKFRDVIALYEDIESICPEGVVQIEKPDRSIFSKKQNKIQVERLLLSVASNSKLRALEPVINFLKPDCLLSEESSHLTPKTPKCSTPPSSNTENSNSTEATRDHPNSANQSEIEIAKFYTPNISSGPPGSEHAPQIVHSQNGSAGDHATLVQKTFRFLNQKSTADHDKMSEDEKYNPFITKDDDGNPLLLMIFSYEKDGYTIEGGTLEQLVEQLYCGTCPDADYIQTFLLGYKLFMQSEELMDMLLQKFADSESYEEEQGDMVKLRLSNIVTQWLERVWVDFHYSDVMIERVDKFVQLVSSGHPRFLPVAMKLENTMQKKKREWEESLREEDRQSGSLPGSGCPSPAESPVSIRRSNSDTKNNDTKSKKRKPVTLMEVTPSQFARHLHCVDFDLMSKVEIHEYFTYFCRKKDPKYHLLTQHLDNWINHWNKVSAWVTSEILHDETPRARAAKIERLIDIAKQLKQLFSFNTLYAFVTGFNHSSVMRLKKTWDHVKSSSQTSLNDLEEFMSNVENFGQYRKHLTKAPRTVCTIPLLSLILRDIEFLNVNSPKLKNGLWNFGKLRLIKNKISELERYKMIKPQNHIQTDDDILAYCRRLPTVPSASFYDISLEREPKDQPRPARPVSVSSLSSVATSSSS